MKLLLCCEFYFPSVGGVQEVMKQVAERLVARGHDVTVATSTLPNRNFSSLNGVQISQFDVKGNLVNGMTGEIERYRQFVRSFDGDAILIKAAQQWTFDALWSDLGDIVVRKVFIPCGFLSFFQPEYQDYFKRLPTVLRQFDALIFYANDYRDINFAREHHIPNCLVLSNGASEIEFEAPVDPGFRKRYGIPEESFLILTVGSLTGAKGHLELAQAVSLLPKNSYHITLLLNGNNPFPEKSPAEKFTSDGLKKEFNSFIWLENAKRILKLFRKTFVFLVKSAFHPIQGINKWKTWRSNVAQSQLTPFDRVRECVNLVNSSSSNKQALLLDLPRQDLVQAYFAADLFVFPSHVEYSPLALFEAAAAGTPFLSSNAGNAKEIIEWLGGGFIMEDSANLEGFRIIDPQVLANEIAVLMNQRPQLIKMGEEMRERWRLNFTWDKIASRYEKVLEG